MNERIWFVVWPMGTQEKAKLFKTKEAAKKWKLENKIFGNIHEVEEMEEEEDGNSGT